MDKTTVLSHFIFECLITEIKISLTRSHSNQAHKSPRNTQGASTKPCVMRVWSSARTWSGTLHWSTWLNCYVHFTSSSWLFQSVWGNLGLIQCVAYGARAGHTVSNAEHFDQERRQLRHFLRNLEVTLILLNLYWLLFTNQSRGQAIVAQETGYCWTSRLGMVTTQLFNEQHICEPRPDAIDIHEDSHFVYMKLV